MSVTIMTDLPERRRSDHLFAYSWVDGMPTGLTLTSGATDEEAAEAYRLMCKALCAGHSVRVDVSGKTRLPIDRLSRDLELGGVERPVYTVTMTNDIHDSYDNRHGRLTYESDGYTIHVRLNPYPYSCSQ